MTEQQVQFYRARDRLVQAVISCGFPAELGKLCARQIGSPKGIDRLTSYVYNVRPKNYMDSEGGIRDSSFFDKSLSSFLLSL